MEPIILFLSEAIHRMSGNVSANSTQFVVLQGTTQGWRYPLVGGTRERHFIGIHLKPHKLPENADSHQSGARCV